MPVEIVVAKRHKGVGDDTRLRAARRLLGMAVGDLAEIVERPQVVLRHAVAVGVHAAELPLRQRLALLGRIFAARKAPWPVAACSGVCGAVPSRNPGLGVSDAFDGVAVPSNAIAG